MATNIKEIWDASVSFVSDVVFRTKKGDDRQNDVPGQFVEEGSQQHQEMLKDAAEFRRTHRKAFKKLAE